MILELEPTAMYCSHTSILQMEQSSKFYIVYLFTLYLPCNMYGVNCVAAVSMIYTIEFMVMANSYVAYMCSWLIRSSGSMVNNVWMSSKYSPPNEILYD